jgi:predicted MFS family arabinose efflux permease
MDFLSSLFGPGNLRYHRQCASFCTLKSPDLQQAFSLILRLLQMHEFSNNAAPKESNGDGVAHPKQVAATPLETPTRNMVATRVLSVCNFLSKGWEVGILSLLAFLQQKYAMPLYLVGLLSTVFIVSQIGVSLFAGKIAHVIHSRNVIRLAIAASGLSWLALFFARHSPVLFLAYALAGAASGLFEPIGVSLVAKLSASNGRGKAIGNFAAFGDMGRIAVVATVTAMAGWFGVNNACAILLATNLAALILATAYLEKPGPDDEGEAPEVRVPLRDLLNLRNFRYATLAGIADSFSSSSLYIFIPFLLTAKGIALANTLYFNVIFFAGYMAGRVFLGRLADRYGAPRTLIVSELMMATLILVLTLASGTAMIVVLLFVLGVFTRGTSPIIRAMVADSLEQQSSFHEAFSVYSFASRGSSAVSRPVYGYLAAYSGIASAFYVASAVSLLALYPAARYGQKDKPPQPQN